MRRTPTQHSASSSAWLGTGAVSKPTLLRLPFAKRTGPKSKSTTLSLSARTIEQEIGELIPRQVNNDGPQGASADCGTQPPVVLIPAENRDRHLLHPDHCAVEQSFDLDARIGRAQQNRVQASPPRRYAPGRFV